jgi:hypothetical protein
MKKIEMPVVATGPERTKIQVLAPFSLERVVWEENDLSAMARVINKRHGNRAVIDRDLLLRVAENFDSLGGFDAWWAESGCNLPPAPVRISADDGTRTDEFGRPMKDRPPIRHFWPYVADASRWAQNRPHTRRASYYAGQTLVNCAHGARLVQLGLAAYVPVGAEELQMAAEVKATMTGCPAYPELEAQKLRVADLQDQLRAIDIELNAGAGLSVGMRVLGFAKHLVSGDKSTGPLTTTGRDELRLRRVATEKALVLLAEEITFTERRLAGQASAALATIVTDARESIANAYATIGVANERLSALARECALVGLVPQYLPSMTPAPLVQLEVWLNHNAQAGKQVA